MNQNILSILIYKDGFSFLTFNENKKLHKGFIPITAEASQFGENFIEAFMNHSISQFPTELVELSFINSNFTLIPKEEFSADTAQNYLELTTTINPFNTIRFNPIPGKNIVVCFAHNEEIEFFFENKYPFVKIIHNATRVIQKIPNDVKHRIQLIFNHKNFEIIGISKQFDYYNNFELASFKDVEYAIKHYLLGRKISNYELVIYGEVEKEKLRVFLDETFRLNTHFIKDSESYALIS